MGGREGGGEMREMEGGGEPLMVEGLDSASTDGEGVDPSWCQHGWRGGRGSGPLIISILPRFCDNGHHDASFYGGLCPL